jgi:hypothetical protein
MSDAVRRAYLTQIMQDIVMNAHIIATREALLRRHIALSVDVTLTVVLDSGDPITCTSSTHRTSTTPTDKG